MRGPGRGEDSPGSSTPSGAGLTSKSFVPRVLLILHGIGEHGGRYFHFPHYLEKTFDAVCTLDHRGHGRSEGERGYVEHFESFAHDAAYTIRRLEDHLNSRFGKSELHVFGHSLGGLITLQMLLRHPNLPIHSVSVSAPALGLATPVPRHKWLAGQVARLLYPKLQLDSELDVTAISRDPEVVGAYQSDRLVHSKVTPGLFFGMQDAMREVLSSESGFEVPLQFLIPECDRLTDSQVSLAFFERLKLRHKRLRTYPDFFHEICNEPGKERVFEDIERWALQSNKDPI
jgi:alpha-beta hydrolase superfamily lysophospholipase